MVVRLWRRKKRKRKKKKKKKTDSTCRPMNQYPPSHLHVWRMIFGRHVGVCLYRPGVVVGGVAGC